MSTSRPRSSNGQMTARGTRRPSLPTKNRKRADLEGSVSRNISSDSADGAAVIVPAAVRTLRVFEVFEHSGEPLTLSRLAEELDVPISSCRNLVQTLIGRGYLFSLEAQRTFYPTRRLCDLANAIASRDPILQRMFPAVGQLRDATGETVIVGKRQDQIALYLLVLESAQTIRYVAASGRTIPLHTSAIGKALLSTLSEKELTQWLGTRRLVKATAKSIINHGELQREVATGRTRGYFLTAGENVPDVGAVSCVLRVAGETFAIAVAGPTVRIQSNRQAIVRLLTETIAKLSAIDW